VKARLPLRRLDLVICITADIKQLQCPKLATTTRFLCSGTRYTSRQLLLLNRRLLPFAHPANCLMAELTGILQMQFRFNPRAIGVDGADSEMKLIADFACAASVSNKLEDLEFSIR